MINAISEMIFDIVITGIITLDFLILYLNVKINSVKTVGICKKNLACSRGNKGMFEYEIDGIKHYNAEKTMHLGAFKIEQKYTIYVNKNNHEKFVSKIVLIDYMIFIIFSGIPFFSPGGGGAGIPETPGKIIIYYALFTNNQLLPLES